MKSDKLPQVMSHESAAGSEDYKFEKENNLWGVVVRKK